MRRLAPVEGSALFATSLGSVLFWCQPGEVCWARLPMFTAQALAISLCSVVAFYYSDLYDLRLVRSFGSFAERLPQALGITLLMMVGFYSLFPEAKMAAGPFVTTVAAALALLLALRAISYRLIRSRPFLERVVVIGSGSLAQQIVAEIQSQPQLCCQVVGVVDEGEGGAADAPLRGLRLGSLREVGRILAEVQADRVVVAMTSRRGRMPVQHLLDLRARGIAVEDGFEVYERLTGKLAIESLTPSSLIFSHDFRKSRLAVAAARGLSMAAAAAGLALVAPLMALIAVAIQLDSPGSVLFLHPRVGKDGRRFNLIKFRTMRAANGATSEWVRDNGDRITRLGKWLRRFRLDELPQFVNVLRGDMNLVGPRPHPVSNYELFASNIPYYSFRSMVRPGITGWAQIRYGYANNLEEETEKMRHDLYYIKHMSLWLDLRILFDTVKTVLLGRGSSTTEACRPEAAFVR